MLSIEETILCAFKKRLASKDERVAELEKKFVEMSFELASMKALADEHGAKRMFLADEHGAKRRFPSGCSHANTTASSPLQADSTLRVISNRRHSFAENKSTVSLLSVWEALSVSAFFSRDN